MPRKIRHKEPPLPYSHSPSMPPQQLPLQQMYPQQIQAQLQNPAQGMHQDRHHLSGQTPSRQEQFINASTHGRDEKPKHKHRHREPSRQGSSYQGSENGAQSEVGGYVPSHGTAHPSMTLRRFLGDPLNYTRGTPSPPPSVYSASDEWSDSGRSESSVTTVRARAAPDRRYPEISGDLSRAYHSSATTSSIAPSSEYGGDDERSESEYTSCGPDPIAYNYSPDEIEVNWYIKRIADSFEAMEAFLSKMQSDVEDMKHDFTSSEGLRSSLLNETCCQSIRFRLDKIHEPLGEIEGWVDACKRLSQISPGIDAWKI